MTKVRDALRSVVGWLSDTLSVSFDVAVVIVISVVFIALQIAALIDIARRDPVRWDSKLLWVLVALASGVDAIIYFIVGRSVAAAGGGTTDVTA